MDNPEPGKHDKGAQEQPIQAHGRGLDNSLAIERVYDPNREAMLAALRVALGLPRPEPPWLRSESR